MTLHRWLTSLLRSLARICDSHSPVLLDLFISFGASICSTMAFPPSATSDDVVVSVSIDFPSNSKQVALFHSMAYAYSHAV